MQVRTQLQRLGAILALACTLPAGAAAASIDFDDRDGALLFADAAPLSSEYAAHGISFAGVGGPGGVLVHQEINLGIGARSGSNFLGVNLDAGSSASQRISFAADLSAVSLFAATYDAEEYAVSFSLSAFDAMGNLLGSTSIAGARDWQELALTAAGIRSVVLSSDAYTWGVDDLSFAVSPVPEPATWGMLGAGLLLMAAAGRRRQ